MNMCFYSGWLKTTQKPSYRDSHSSDTVTSCHRALAATLQQALSRRNLAWGTGSRGQFGTSSTGHSEASSLCFSFVFGHLALVYLELSSSKFVQLPWLMVCSMMSFLSSASWGPVENFDKNCDRDMKRNLYKPALGSTTSDITLPMKTGPNRTEDKPHPMIWPHMLFAELYHSNPEAFQHRLCGGNIENIPKFWDAMTTHPAFEHHPMRLRTDTHYYSKAIAIAVHGDEVPVKGVGKSWGQSAACYNWSSCLSNCSVLLKNFLVSFIYQGLMVKPSKDVNLTLDKFFKELHWSLLACYRGKWPTEDSDGNPLHDSKGGTWLAAGHFLVLWLLQGDLLHFFKDIKLNYSGSNKPCFCCPCVKVDNSPMAWTNFKKTAAWLSKIWGHVEWNLRNPNRHWLLRLPGAGITMAVPDCMHTKHAGTDAYFLGSVLTLITHHIMPKSPVENLQDMWQTIKDNFPASDPSNQFTDMKVSMYYKDNKFPCLKGRAAQIRHLAPGLLWFFKLIMNPMEDAHRFVKLCLEIIVRSDEILKITEFQYKVPRPLADELLEKTHVFLGALTYLRRHYDGTLLFHITIKSHYLLHVVLSAAYVHPKLAWCYGGEHFVGRMRPIIGSCQRGTKASQVAHKVVRKYLYGLDLALQDDAFV